LAALTGRLFSLLSDEEIAMKFIMFALFLSASFLASFLGSMYGWGLEVKSWSWLIGSWFASVFLMAISKVIASE
jgi:hypothetical protein